MDKLHRYPAAAEILGIAEQTLREKVSKGEIACIKIGRAVCFSDEILERYVKAHYVPSIYEPKTRRRK